jgi:hypothetical protein
MTGGSFSRKGPSALAAFALTGTVLVGSAGGMSRTAQAETGMAGAVKAAAAATNRVQPGTRVRGQTSATAPAPPAAQRRHLLNTGYRDGHRGIVAQAPVRGPLGPGTTSPREAPAAPTDLSFYRNGRLPAGGQRSPVNEPSTTQSGRNIFATGNWYAAYSHDTGASWTYLNPFTIFGAGFCCDQVTVNDVSHDRQFWLLQYNNRLVLANSGTNNLASWCYYNWTPASFGLPAGATFDYNKLALTTSFVYFTTNVYGASGGSLVARFPIDAMTNCAGFSYSWYYRTTEFSPAFIQNAGDSMYWGTNWSNLALGSTFRVLRWPDTSASATVYDRNIAPFVFMFIGGGRCGSADGVVLNWCQRTDSRTTGSGYLALPAKGSGESVLGWAFNAQQDASHPFPYIRRVYFRSSDLTYLGSSEFFGTWAAHLYPTLAPDYRGHIGMAFAWGGGTGTAHYYPGSGIMVDDDVTPAQPWSYSFYQYGAGNACLNTADGRRRWGDYLDVHPFYPSGYGWVASGFALTSNAGACNTVANVSVANVAFGRTRDLTAYTRWR